MHRHPGYTFRPKPKKNRKPTATKAKEAVKSATQEDVKDPDYIPSPLFSCKVEKDYHYQQQSQQQAQLGYVDTAMNEDASSCYFQSIANYAPVPLEEDSLNLDTNNATMYVDPALLHNDYMDINAAEPIPFDFEADPAMFALLANSTPASQMLETPSLEYYQSPVSLSLPLLGHQVGFQQTIQQAMQHQHQQQQQQEQQLDTPHLFDYTVIPAGYSNEYGKLFDSLDSSSSVSSSDLLHTPISNTQANNDFVNFIYGTGNPNIIFLE
ncbi:unnamed protein product [Mucor circinelloides]